MDKTKHMDKIKDMIITKDTKLQDIARHYKDSGGFVAKKLGIAADIMSEMLDKAEIKFLSFPACIISTGTRGIIKDVIKKKLFDIIVTTCGTLDHDFARSFKPYYHGSFDSSDVSLHEQGICREGNIFIPNESHGIIIEKKLQPILNELYNNGKRDISSYEFSWEIGKAIESDKSIAQKEKEGSILYWAWKNKIPVIVPGITDGAFGFQISMFAQDHDFTIDVFKDELFLLNKLFGSNVKTGALIIGGGISKHHVIWWNQFCHGLDYAVYITTAPEWDGSLSGARPREAISWGKVNEDARFVTVEGDATALLPLILGRFL